MKENNSKKLKYRIIEASSEDPEYPVFELLKGMESNGWVSSRFCNYPQEILIQFLSPVNLKQINILSHEKKISSMIEFFSFFPSTNTDIFLNIKALNYEKLGYVRMDNNSKTNFKAREFRKIYVNSNCLYLKISLQRNYINKFNVFNQVSLISIDFYGEPVNVPKVELLIEENLKTNNLNEEQMDELAIEKIRILRQSMDEASKIEDFDEAKRIKGNIDKVRMIGKKIFEHEFQKKIAINNEDFDKAKILKMEIDKLKSFIRNIDKQVLNLSPIDNHNKTDIDINIKLKNLYDIEETKIGQGENMSFYNDIINDKSLSRGNRSLEEELLINHDEEIIPTLNKKKKNTSFVEDEVPKIDLEPLDKEIQYTYEIFIPFIGEENLRKIFSHHPTYKTEGLQTFIDKMDKIFSEKSKLVNNYINLTMKLDYTMLNDKHKQVGIKALEIFEKLLGKIKALNEITDLNYDLNITDHILSKIKEKVGDVSSKLRKRAVDLYDFMIKQEFCDYNNLIAELIDDEIKSEKKHNKSSKTIMGKLSILDNVMLDYKTAISDKRTDVKSFPYNKILIYTIDNITHPKSEVRKLSRTVLVKLYKQFGFEKKMENLLSKVDERELIKLVENIPEVEEILKFEEIKRFENSPDYRSRNNSFEYVSKSLNNSYNANTNKTRFLVCQKCGKTGKKFLTEDDIISHHKNSCVMFMNCQKCKRNIEIKNYLKHLTEECPGKDEFKLCKRCKEPINIKFYDNHVKENKCNPAKNPISANRCLLCHMDIPPSNKGWLTHLVKDKCYKNPRKYK